MEECTGDVVETMSGSGALCAADICASNAETFPGIAPGEDSTVLEAPFHRTTPVLYEGGCFQDK